MEFPLGGDGRIDGGEDKEAMNKGGGSRESEVASGGDGGDAAG